MKQWLIGSILVVGIVLLLSITYAAFSQQEPAAPGEGRPADGGAMRGAGEPGRGRARTGPLQAMKAGEQGVFVMQGNTLLKYPPTLQGTPAKLDLGTPAAAENAPRNHPQPGTFLLAGDDVLLVLGGTYYRVDGKALTITKKITLPALTQPALSAGGGQQMPPRTPHPELVLNNHTLYVLRGASMVALNIEDGTILGQATLPKPSDAPPTPPNDAPAPPQ